LLDKGLKKKILSGKMFHKLYTVPFIYRVKNESKEHWIALLEEHGIPCGNINNIKEAYEQPSVKNHLQVFEHAEYGTVRLPGMTVFCIKR